MLQFFAEKLLADNTPRLSRVFVAHTISRRFSSHGQVYRNKAWNQLLNICTIVHLALPMVQIQRCLPCLGAEKLAEDANLLHIGTYCLSSSWAMLILFSVDLSAATCRMPTVTGCMHFSLRTSRAAAHSHPCPNGQFQHILSTARSLHRLRREALLCTHESTSPLARAHTSGEATLYFSR